VPPLARETVVVVVLEHPEETVIVVMAALPLGRVGLVLKAL
jgi:hypothetical protein